MITPDESVIKAIISLKNSPSFDGFVDWLRDSLVQQSIKNNHKIGENAIKTAGGNIELESILDHIDHAEDYIINIKQAKAAIGPIGGTH